MTKAALTLGDLFMAMGELLDELTHTLPTLFWSMTTGLARLGAISSYFIRDTFRAHFNLIAQYTAPIEQELLNKNPPKPSDLNPLGQIALTIFPLTIVSWLAALTAAPLIYNSVLLFIAGFVRVTNLALFDLPRRQINILEGSMPWYRIIFGLPGLIIGGSLGAISAGLISLVRLTINSFKSGKYSFVKITNLALDQDDYLLFDQDERSKIEKYGFGLPGLVFGGIVGAVGFTAAGLGRVVINSFFSFISINASAFNLVRQEKFKGGLQDGRTPFLIYGLGLPGLILGSITAPVAIAIAGAERIAIESWKTTKELFFATVKLALPAEQPEEAQELMEEVKREKRAKLNAYGFGAPGVLLGVLSGSIGFAGIVFARIVANSIASGAFSFIHVTNLALDPNDRLPQIQEEGSKIKRYGFGFPGIVLGGIAGGLGFAVASLGRVAINSWFSFIGLNASAFNLVRQEKTNRGLNDGRSPFLIYGLGFPGLILGSITAPVAIAITGAERIAIESWKTTKELFFATVKLALPAEQPEEAQELMEEVKREKRSKLNAYGFGAPGVLLGVLSGSIGFAGIVFARIVANSLASGAFSFIHVTNLALDPNDRLPQIQEEGSKIKRYGFGFPGIVLGGIAGGLGFAVAGLGRVAINSWFSFIGLNASAFNLVRQEKTNRGLKDGRTPFLIYGLGLPGLILGSITAPVAIAIAGAERIAIESWKTTKEIFIAIVNLILPAKKPEESTQESAEENKRSKLDTYGFGAPGLLLGIISGGIGFVGILCARILINSLISALYMFILITNKALDPADEIPQIQDRRSTLEVCGFGLPGLFLGALIGRLGFFAVGLGRIAVNSFFTFVNLNAAAFNLVRQEKINLGLRNGRTPFLIYGLGLPGLILGSFTAPIAITIAITERIAKESWKTTKELFFAAVKLALPAEKLGKSSEQVEESKKEKRSKLNAYGFGAPGILLGLVSGGIGFTAIGLARTVTNSFISGLNSFIRVTNLALDPKNYISQPLDQRSKIEKYGFGLPGLVLGGIVGGLGFSAAGLGRVATNSFFTFVSLNAAAFNLVRQEKINRGLRDGRSPFLIYGLGLPGLILGGITSPAAIAIAVAERIFIESWKTTKEFFFAFVKLALPAEEIEAQERSQLSQTATDNKKRSKLDTYVFGAPGILLGILSGE
ncbi:hypothetical protein [Legionella micdadei]|uniref:hypothetical protein n=1 Tax=Legionella micdadei TaxID=451 RepID=UPI0009EF7980|nr:hypothetical protein [Legionella micdadei]ARG99347.1 hypothetical protein B6V88_02290 [Legionella micdadei]